MQVIIHRGTHQIGGCITQIRSDKGTRIAIDIGQNLPSKGKNKLDEIDIPGLTSGNMDFKAVFVTHYHGDHIGLYNKILPGIPIYIGDISKQIYKTLGERLVKAKITSKKDIELIESFKTYSAPHKIKIDDIVVTPLEVDHSAFNAHMFLIECDGKKLLHTGDFRSHGPRGKTLIPTLKTYVGNVDCLICEGTTLSRGDYETVSEYDLKQEAKKIFEQNKYCFVMCSSTNIDRIAEIHKACIESNRLFVCDNYQKDILMYIDSISKSALYKFKKKVLSYDDNILNLMKDRGFVMLVRPNYISKKVISEFADYKFIYSMWNGYLDEENKDEYEYIQEFVPKDHIYLHTSGHADFNTIKKVCMTVNPKKIIPIHGNNPEAFTKMRFGKCKYTFIRR